MALFGSIFGGNGGLFSTLKQQQAQKDMRPQIRQFDVSVLAFANPVRLPQSAFNTQPAVKAPWEIPQEPQTLARRINMVRDLGNFIDQKAKGVDSLGVSNDARSTFIAFDALTKLETLAQFAAENSTPTASLARLDEQFQKGLQQVRDFITQAPTDKLDLLTGPRSATTRSLIEPGKDSQSFTGTSVATGSRDDPIPGLLGDEVFTLRMTRFGETEDIVIDLAGIGGPPSINAIVDHVNAAITAIKAFDENGDPILDANGDPVPKFSTRFSVETDENFDHALKVSTTRFEEARLIPAVAEPELIIASNRADIRGNTPQTARLVRFGDLSGALTQEARTDIFGLDRDATTIAASAGTDDTDIADALDDTEAANAKKPESDTEAVSVAANTRTAAIAVDSEGFVYTLGTSAGDFGNHINTSGSDDVFLTKHDSAGNIVFSRLVGSRDKAEGFALAIDSNDNVIIAGSTSDNIASGARVPGIDSFVTKFNSRGDTLFTYQLDTAAEDVPAAITIDSNDNIILTGFSRGAIDAATPSHGGQDTMLLKIDGQTGIRTDQVLLGGTGDERGQAVAVANDGNLLVASNENGRAILRKIDVNDLGNVLFEQDLGLITSSGSISAIRVSGSDIFLAGSTSNVAFDGSAANVVNGPSGGMDGFLMKLQDQGASATADYITFVGTSATDQVQDIALGASSVYLAGSTRGDLSGEGRHGTQDGFVARINMATGQTENISQFGTMLTDTRSSGLALAPTGKSVVDILGLPLGNLDRIESRNIEAQSTARAGDYFEISINGGRAQKIELKAGDTLESLAAQVNRLSTRREVEAEVIGGELFLRAQGTAKIDIFSGKNDRDLLAGLGIKPQRLLGTQALFNLDDKKPQRSSVKAEPKLGGAFAFNLDQPLSLKNKQAAAFTLKQVENAINTAKRAFRSLTPNLLDSLGGPKGTVPPQLSKELANYSAALQRLQAGQIGGGGFFI